MAASSQPTHIVRPESMLQKNNTALQRPPKPVDLHFSMKIAGRTHPAIPIHEQASLGHLAHEMNSLLDGSLRSIALAERSLDQSAVFQDEVINDAVSRLRAAQGAMQQMAVLLSRAMRSMPSAADLFNEQDRLEVQIHAIVQNVQPLAHQHHVHLELELTPKASALQIGPLGPVILNGLRNAIEASASAEHPRQATLAVAVNAADQLMILIADNGPGLPSNFAIGRSDKATGHGLGLELCQRIITELGGDLRFANVPFGRGAIMQVTVPVRSLARHE